jgi:hypothetical protein
MNWLALGIYLLVMCAGHLWWPVVQSLIAAPELTWLVAGG